MASSLGSTGRSSTEDTFTRLLRLGQAAAGRSFGPIVKQTHLMEASEQALHAATSNEHQPTRQVAARILECVQTYRHWETQHQRLLSRIADQPHRGRQTATALSTTFSLIYARSLFEYLRESGARRARRRKLIAHFHGESGYVKGLLAEHGNYLRSAASLICIKYVGNSVLRHGAFGQPMEEYERTYAEYFRTYCQWAVPARADQDDELLNSLQQEQKLAVLAARQRLVAMPIRPVHRP